MNKFSYSPIIIKESSYIMFKNKKTRLSAKYRNGSCLMESNYLLEYLHMKTLKYDNMSIPGLNSCSPFFTFTLQARNSKNLFWLHTYQHFTFRLFKAWFI